MDKTKILRELGLSEKEIEVYISLLPLGFVTLQGVVKKVTLPRTTVYNTLNYLSAKGMVSKIIKRGVTYFSAANPSVLKDKLHEKLRLVECVIPELKNLQKSDDIMASIEVFDGFKGAYSVLSDIFSIPQQTYYFGGYNKSLEVLKHIPAHARMMRIEKNIPAKIVIDPSQEDIFSDKQYMAITELRFTESLRGFPVMFFIYGEKVAVFTVKEGLISFIISIPTFTKAVKMMFDVYWNMGSPAH